MYNEDVTRVPRDADDLWVVLREQFDFVRDVLWDTEIETHEDALDNIYHRQNDAGAVQRGSMAAIRYRGTSEELNQLDHFLEMGRSLLPFIDQEIDERRMSPEFVQQWGKVMFCHGFVAAHVFDDTDVLAHQRAGRKTGQMRSKDAQRKWLAHIMVPLMDAGLKRAQAEEVVVACVAKALEHADLRGDFPETWFRAIVTHGGLASTYDNKHFSKKQMRTLLVEPADDIPPLPDKVP